MSTTDQTAVVPTTTATGGTIQSTAAGALAAAIADAARAVDGVHDLGTPVGRVVASIRAAAAGRQFAPGVRIDQLTGGVQVDVVAEYPVNVIEVADRVRAAVVAVRGVDGNRVDVLVTDVHGPFDRDAPVGDPLAGAKDGVAAPADSAKTVAADAADAARTGAETVADAAQAGAKALADGTRDTAAAAAEGAKAGAQAVADGTRDAADAVAEGAKTGAATAADGAAVVAERAKAVADAVRAEPARGDADVERSTVEPTTVTADTVVVVVEPERSSDDERSTDRRTERTDGGR